MDGHWLIQDHLLCVIQIKIYGSKICLTTCNLKCFKLDLELTIELSTHATLNMSNSIIADHPPKQAVIMCKYFVSLKLLILPTSRIFNTEDQFIVMVRVVLDIGIL